MKAVLYDKTGKVKIGDLDFILDDNKSVEEERNGIFELIFNYPNEYPLADQLIEENFIEVKPNDDQLPQKFRIYNTKKILSNIITVFARHETFDLANDHIENINLPNASCEYALNTLFRNSHFSKDFRGYSDIVNAQDFAIDNVNILNAIAGKEGSIIDTYGTGAEILRDGKNIHVLNKRGHDNGVTIEYGKNLTGFELNVDLSGLETRCGGFAKYKPSSSDEEIIVKSDWIDSPFIENFSHPYINTQGRRDYSNKFKDGVIPTKEALNKLCQDEFKINKRDIPSSNYKINFIPLSKCVGYEGIEDKISLCDTVTIIDPRFNINTKAKVIKYKYDFIKERYISMELGEPRTTLGDIIGNGGKVEQGPPGPPGKDGNVEDFPNSLPAIPILTATVKGFASIDLSWTYEDKVYYTYEVYASKTKDFTANIFDLIHEGQTSSFLFQAKPNETWYFRVCAKNTHGNRTEFSSQVTVTTQKADNFDEYFSSLAVGKLVANIFSADYMEAGIIKGHWIDAKNLSVTDGNGKRTFDIDSFGNINADINTLKVRGEDIGDIYANKTELNQMSNQIELKASSIQNNILNNSNGFSHVDWWAVSSANLTIRTCITNSEIKKGFHLVNGTTEGIRFSQEIPIDGETDYTIQVNCKEIQPNVLNGYRITIQDVNSNVLVDSGSITKNGVYRLHFRLPKTAYYKLGLWHNGASQTHGSVIILEDTLLVKNRFDYDLPWVDNVNDKASIAVKAGQIVNKVSKDDVTAIIEHNPKSVEVAFNSITGNVQNAEGKFIVRNGAIELYNNQGLKCFSMDPTGWLNVWGLKVFGPQNPIQFTGDGDKGIEINANRENLCYIDFSRNGVSNDYTARIAQFPNNGSLLTFIGGIEVIPDVRTSSDAKIELRSPTQGPAYIDFSHGQYEDFQKRIISFNGDPQLHINGGVTIDGPRLMVDRIARNTNSATTSLYIENNIDMQGLSIYNAVIPMNANYSRPLSFNFIKSPTKLTSSDVLDAINFNECVSEDNIIGLKMDLSNIIDTSFVTMDKDSNLYGDQGELLKLALKEIQDLKAKVRKLETNSQGGA